MYSIGPTILVHEFPCMINAKCLEVIIGIADFVAFGSVADFKIDHVFSREAVQPMCVTDPCFESGTHACSWVSPASVTSTGLPCRM